MFTALIIITLAIFACLTALCLYLLVENYEYRKQLSEIQESIVELHDVLPDSYPAEGYKYIGMRFQNEIKPYITIDEENKRLVLKVLNRK